MIDEISLKEFASGSIDIVKNRCCICVNFIFELRKRIEIFLFYLDYDKSYFEYYKRGKKSSFLRSMYT